jgi:hypothetical protein
MPFSPDVFQRIITAVAAKNVRTPGIVPDCSFCGHPRWTVGDGFVTFYLTYGYSPFQPGGNTLPSLALICQNCGNTVFLNILMLGLGDLIGYVGE